MDPYLIRKKNNQKTWFLMFGFLLVITALGFIISYYLKNPLLVYFFIGGSLCFNAYSYFNGDHFVLHKFGAIKIKREDHKQLWNAVENLSITAGLPMPKIYIIHNSAPNAFATGRDKHHASVAFTTGLLELLDENELQGVIAHELSHIKNRDILIGTIVIMLVGTVILLSNIAIQTLLYSSRDKKTNPLMFIVGILFIILSPIASRIIQLTISRKREFVADSSAVLLTRYPQGLASALLKIESSMIPMKNSSSATEHIFIMNSLKKKKSFFKKIFSTHPETKDRVKNLLGNNIL